MSALILRCSQHYVCYCHKIICRGLEFIAC